MLSGTFYPAKAQRLPFIHDITGVKLAETLIVTCLIGENVPAGADEGITADVTGVITFGESVSGNTLFVLTP